MRDPLPKRPDAGAVFLRPVPRPRVPGLPFDAADAYPLPKCPEAGPRLALPALETRPEVRRERFHALDAALPLPNVPLVMEDPDACPPGKVGIELGAVEPPRVNAEGEDPVAPAAPDIEVDESGIPLPLDARPVFTDRSANVLLVPPAKPLPAGRVRQIPSRWIELPKLPLPAVQLEAVPGAIAVPILLPLDVEAGPEALVRDGVELALCCACAAWAAMAQATENKTAETETLCVRQIIHCPLPEPGGSWRIS